MGKKLDALLGRNFNISKFKTVTKLAISRGVILKNQHQARYFYARSDVIELLNLGHHERALTRVAYVIKEQNMLDALVMIDHCCHLLIERVLLIQNNKDCPDELKEAISSLIFASSRCGEFPELQKIREIFSERFGSEFAARAVEVRSNCGVNPRIVQKLSSRRCSLESRLKALKEISSEMGITLHLEEDIRAPVKEKLDMEEKQSKPMEPAIFNAPKLQDDDHNLPEELKQYENLSESVEARKYYRGVAGAAQHAFESADYAAEASRETFDLSRSESRYHGSDDHGGSCHSPRTASNSDMSIMPDLKSDKYAVVNEGGDSNSRVGLDKIYTVDRFGSESEGEDVTDKTRKIHFKKLEENERKTVRERTQSASSSDSHGNILSMAKQFSGLQNRNEQGGIVVASGDDDNNRGKNNQGNIAWHKHHGLDLQNKPTLPFNKQLHKQEYNVFDEQYPSDENIQKKHQLPAADSLKSLDESRNTTFTSTQGFAELLHTHQHSNIDWKKFSVRTTRVQKA